MSRYRVYYDKIYCGSTTHTWDVVNMDWPSESAAISELRRRGTINSSDNIVITAIELD